MPVSLSWVLNIARQPYYRWLTKPVTDAGLIEAYRAKALFDAHTDDPEFGYRFLGDEAKEAGESMAKRTAWRICSEWAGGPRTARSAAATARCPGRRSTTTCAPSLTNTASSGTKVFFADPHSAWQRPSNENTNGLLRQYFPKGTDLSRWSAEDLESVAHALNSRPRKVLEWKTPAEVFEEQLRLLQQPGLASTD